LKNDKILSSLIGGALGDALGYKVEFDGIEVITQNLFAYKWQAYDLNMGRFAERFRTKDGKSLVSDDTQMTIATGRALIETTATSTVDFAGEFADNLSKRYVTWSKHPDNNRAPGGACMRACNNMAKGLHWSDATDINTMGCGANMRVAPIALIQDPGVGSRINLAYLSSAVTHAHPAALASAALTVMAISGAYDGMNGREILDMLIELCRDHHNNHYPTDVLGDLWEQSEYGSARAYLRAGYEECKGYLLSARTALNIGWKGDTDPCEITGQGWTAPEALAGAMLCVAGLWDNPVQVLQRAAVSNGDSDSLAAIAGNIRGAAGVEWPYEWSHGLETGPTRELWHLSMSL
jgi:ADP-ribosylglycohydrolase